MYSRLLLLTGMHRSGTSALAELLHRQGVGIATEMLAEQPAVNARGFWEDEHLVAYNEQILAACDCQWYELSPLEARRLPGILDNSVRDQALQYLRETYGHQRLSLCKDPRFCRTLPFWLPLLNELSIRLAPVLVLRDPAQVAASLYLRDALPQEYACLLWLVYLRDALSHLAGLNAMIIDYETLLRRPADCLDRLADHFDLAWPDSPPTSIIDQELQHQRITTMPLDCSIEPGATIAWLHHELQSLTWLELSVCERCLVRIDRTLEGVDNWRWQLSLMARKVIAEQADLQNLGTLHTRALAVITEKDRQLDGLAGHWQEARTTIADKDKQLADLEQQWQQAHATIKDKDLQLAELSELWHSACSTIKDKDQQLAELSKLWDSACSTIEDKDRDLAHLAKELEHAQGVVEERDVQLVEQEWLYKGWLGLPNRLRRKWRI